MALEERDSWQQADSILDELLDLDAEARRRRLEELSEQPDLRSKVEALLQAAETEGGALDQAFGRFAVASEGRLESAVGRTIGAWVLEEELGRGGMAVVYRANRRQADFDQPVALKLLTIGMLGGDGARRFRAEQRILASLQHPNIASLVDGGVAEDGTPYLVMELVRGVPIDRYCEEKKLAPAERLRIFLEVCDAVAFAHRNLIVHRDLKPSNILVDQRGAPRLLDFGIAKLVEEEGERQTSTQILTPGYAAPEQHSGGRVTTATDVFGLGVVLYRLLTGDSPFAVGAAQRSEAKAAPLATLDSDLRDVVLMALRPEPDRRYADARALAEDLVRFLANRPVAATRDSRGYRLRKFVRRHRAGVAASLVAVTGLLAGTGVALWQAEQARRQARVATVEAQKAREMGVFLAGLFESSDPTTSQGEDLRASEILRRGAESLADELAGQPELRAELLLTIGAIQRQLGLFDDASLSLDQAASGLRVAGDPRRWTDAVLELSRLEMGRGEYEEAEQRLREHHRSILEDDVAATWRRLLVDERLAEALIFQSRIEQSAAVAEEALDRMDRERLDDPVLRIGLLRNLGAAHELSGDFDRAAALLRHAVELERKRQEPAGTELASLLTDLGITLGKAGNVEASEAALREGLELLRKLLGDEHPAYASGLQNLALNLYFQDRLDESVSMLAESREVKLRAVGPEHPSTATTTYNLARLEHELGRLEEAEEHYLEARRIYAATLPPQHHSRGDLLSLYGALLFDAGRYGEAERVLSEALAIQRSNFADEHLGVATAKLRLGRTLTSQGRLAESGSLLEEALAAVRAGRGDDDGLTQEGRIALAEWHRERGEPEAAAALFAAARGHLREGRARYRRLTDSLP